MAAIDNIREYLNERGMTITDLADKSGLAFATISRILNGKQELKPNSLSKIADALGVSPYELDGNSDGYTASKFEVCGYLDYCGEITRIKSLKDLQKYVKKAERDAVFFKHREKKLPKQNEISLTDIDFSRWESIDATQKEVKSFRHHYDIIDEDKFNVGNMCPGYPFILNNISFNNSESAYIAGLYSTTDAEHIRIQKALIANNDGYKAKKEFRHARYAHIARKDWEEFNVEWMKYVVWQKCKTNKDFAELLKKIPRTAFVVENSTGMTGKTAQFWGCFNQDLMDLREAKAKQYKMTHSKANKDILNEEENRWHNYGTWEGVDMMGKIIKACSLCLLDGVELPIDYNLLNSKGIHLLGQSIQFSIPTDELNIPSWDEKAAIERLRKGYFAQTGLRVSVYSNNLEIFRAGRYMTADGRVVDLSGNDTMLNGTIVYNALKRPVIKGEVKYDTITDVQNIDCLSLAEQMIGEGYNPVVLNLANRTYACGAYHKGSRAQEESLCRSSNLSQSLYQYYKKEAAIRSSAEFKGSAYPMDETYGAIYSPCVQVFRGSQQSGFNLLAKPWEVAIISCAALNFGEKYGPDHKYRTEDGGFTSDGMFVMKNKIRTIMGAAIENKHDSIILGAFGCGAFRLKPELVSELFYAVLKEPEYRDAFRKVSFAILERPDEEGKYKSFYERFGNA